MTCPWEDLDIVDVRGDNGDQLVGQLDQVEGGIAAGATGRGALPLKED